MRVTILCLFACLSFGTVYSASIGQQKIDLSAIQQHIQGVLANPAVSTSIDNFLSQHDINLQEVLSIVQNINLQEVLNFVQGINFQGILENAYEQVAEFLASNPQILNFVQNLLDLPNGKQLLKNWFNDIINGVGDIINQGIDLIPVVIDNLDNIIDVINIIDGSVGKRDLSAIQQQIQNLLANKPEIAAAISNFLNQNNINQETIQNVAQGLIDRLTEFVSANPQILNFVQNLLNRPNGKQLLKNWFNDIINGVTDIINQGIELVPVVIDNLDNIVDIINVIDGTVGKRDLDLAAIQQQIQNLLANVPESVQNIAQNLVDRLTEFVSANPQILNFVQNLLNRPNGKQLTKNWFNDIINGVGNVINQGVDVINQGISTTLDLVPVVIDNLDNIVDIINIIDTLDAAGKRSLDLAAVQQQIQAILANVPQSVQNVATTIFDKIGQFLAAHPQVLTALQNLLDLPNGRQLVKNWFNDIISGVGNVINQGVDVISQGVSTVVPVVVDNLDTIISVANLAAIAAGK